MTDKFLRTVEQKVIDLKNDFKIEYNSPEDRLLDEMLEVVLSTEDHDDEIDRSQDKVDSLEQDIDNLNFENDDLQEKVSELEDEVAELKEQINGA